MKNMKNNRIMLVISFTWLVMISSAMSISPHAIQTCNNFYGDCKVSFIESLESTGLLFVGLVTITVLGVTIIREIFNYAEKQKEKKEQVE